MIFNCIKYINEISYEKFIEFAEFECTTDEYETEYIVRSLACDENILSRLCESKKKISKNLFALALKEISGITFHGFGYKASNKKESFFEEYDRSIAEMVYSGSVCELLNKLIFHYRRFGGGREAQYKAFILDGKTEKLKGIKHVDNISFDNLYCIDEQKKILIRNTTDFLEGRPAHNVLLTGSSGTGKSSCVKALLNMFARDGLRLIQVSKSNISSLPRLLEIIKNKPHKFIIFMDDLSFDETDVDYKTLKIFLDGQIEQKSDNVRIYATSNRRHLITRYFNDRASDSEVNIGETAVEKISLAERFGINITFTPPTKQEYLAIIEGILKERGIPMTDKITQEALIWEMRYNGRSGRTARQFADSIKEI